MNRQYNRGSVLIISLIMLSVVTMMVVAYLSFARFERSSVAMSMLQTESRFAVESSLAQAQADIANKLRANENYQPFVSVEPVSANRVPVDINRDINRDKIPDDDRFYLDLNRSGKFETNGIPYLGASIMGDPEWIGVLADPSKPHDKDNRYVARYAYMVIPANKTLDLNHIHNKIKDTGFSRDGYKRGTGNASWDLNLAGLMNALDGAMWTYGSYSENANSSGTAFDQSYGWYQPGSDQDQGRVTGLYAYRYSFYHPVSRQPILSGDKGYGGYIPMGAPNGREFYDIFNVLNGRPTEDYRLNNYEFFSSQIRKANPYAFNHLAGSIGTVLQPPPTGKLDLNAFHPNLIAVTDFDANRNSLELQLPHSLTNGSVVNLLDVGQTPFQFQLPSNPGTILTLPNSKSVIVEVDPQNPARILLRWPDGQILDLEPMPKGKFIWYLDRSTAMFREVARRLLQLPDPMLVVSQAYPDLLIGFDIPANDPQFGMTPNNLRLLQVAANIVDAFSQNAYPSVFRPVTVPDGANNILIKDFIREPNANFLSSYGGPINPTAFQLNGEKREMTPLIGVNTRFNKSITPSLSEISLQATMRISQPPTGGSVQLYARPELILNFETFNPAPPANPTFEHTIVKGRVKGRYFLNSTTVGTAFDIALTPMSFPLSPGTTPTLTTGPFAIGGATSVSTRRAYWKVEVEEVELRYHLAQGGMLLDFVHVHLPAKEIPVVSNLGGVWSANTDYKAGDRAVISIGASTGVYYARVNHNSGFMADMLKWRSEYWQSATDYKYGDFVRASVPTAAGGFEEQLYFAAVAHRSGNAFTTADASKFWFIYNGESREISWQTRDPLVNNHEWNYTPLLLPFNAPMGNLLLHPAYSSVPRLDPNANAMHVDSLSASPTYGSGCRDPLVNHANWGFATAPFGNVGWLGAIHRGTPWQTIHFKSSRYGEVEVSGIGANPSIINTVENHPYKDGDKVDVVSWQTGASKINSAMNQSAFVRVIGPKTIGLFYIQGDVLDPTVSPDGTADLSVINPGPNQTKGKVFLKSNDPWVRWAGSVDTHPANDFRLADLFEARLIQEQPAIAPNARGLYVANAEAFKGLLSVNQTYPAAWAAVLSAVSLPGNPRIAPNDGKSQLLIQGINAHRNLYYGNQPYPTRGEILRVPELTDASPYLSSTSAESTFEAVPQQILSLLREDEEPIFVIYSFIQAIKPAQGGIDPAGMCNNYSVKSEFAARTVVRQHNWKQIANARASSLTPPPPRFLIVNQIPMSGSSSPMPANTIPLSYR